MKVQPPEIIVTQEEPTLRSIQTAYNQWNAQRNRYDILHRYYIGDHDFAATRDPDGNRIVSNFCNYIPKALRGYMLGNRPHYVRDDNDTAARDIFDLFERQDKWLIDSQICLDMSIHGKAFELVFLPRDGKDPSSVTVSPRDAFVAYTGDMERDSVFGLVRYSYIDEKNVTHYTYYVYDREFLTVYESTSKEPTWVPKGEPVPHGFGRVPLIEYRNNREMMGDFETVLDEQDAYNALLSDRQDDKDAFAASMLYVQGMILGTTPDELKEGRRFLKDNRIVQGTEDTQVSWLTKTMDESSTQILQDQYAANIHKFSMVPDLSDEAFAGNASGVAMAYKLFGTDQMVAEKIAQFRQGFRRRCKLYDWRMHNPSNRPGYEPVADIGAMDIEFALNVPLDLSYMATAITQLTTSKVMSRRTAMTLLSVIPDVEEEQERIREETEEDNAAMQSVYDADPVEDGRRLNGDEDGQSEEDTEE